MNRGEIYRTREKIPERGHKPGFYVVISRNFVAQNDDISTVICAPVYSEILGLRSEVMLGVEDGLPRDSSIRCDFLTLMFKNRLFLLFQFFRTQWNCHFNFVGFKFMPGSAIHPQPAVFCPGFGSS